MSKKRKLALLAAAIAALIVIIDQVVKIWVKTHMYMGEDREIASWFHIRFIENNGMAFGWELGGKYFLTSFRIVAIIAIAIYMYQYIRSRRNPRTFYVVCGALIFAGALGNVIDCLFYGLIFNDPMPPAVAQFVPWGQGYETLMLGRVVDMLYFPLVEWQMPDWQWLSAVPFLPSAGEHCTFFSPIFNVADAAVSCAIILLFVNILFFNKK